MSHWQQYTQHGQDDERNKLLQAQQQLTKTRSELGEAMSQRSQTPISSLRDLQRKDEEIEDLRRRCELLEAQAREAKARLEEKDTRIRQQQETIQVHSKELSKFHDRPQKFAPSPVKYPSQFNQQSQTFAPLPPPPSSYNSGQPQMPAVNAPNTLRSKFGPIPNNASAENAQRIPSWQKQTLTSPGNQSMRGGNGYGVDGRGSPIPLSQMNGLNIGARPGAPKSSYTTPPRNRLPPIGTKDPNFTPGTSNSSPGGALVHKAPLQTPKSSVSASSQARGNDGRLSSSAATSVEEQKVKAFEAFFDLVVAFSHKHVNFPSNQRDNFMPQLVKDTLIKGATTTTAARFMQSQKTRYYLVAKVILDWVQSHVFREDALVGLDEEIDSTIQSDRKKIFGNTEPAVRHLFLTDIAVQFQRLKSHPKYGDFMSFLINNRTLALWDIVKPMMHQETERDWEDMYDLMSQAHRLAELQFTDPDEYQFYYPQHNDSFSDASMVNMDVDFENMPAQVIVARRGTVRLAAVPQVMCRTTSSEGKVSTMTLLKAGVLLQFPKPRR